MYCNQTCWEIKCYGNQQLLQFSVVSAATALFLLRGLVCGGQPLSIARVGVLGIGIHEQRVLLTL